MRELLANDTPGAAASVLLAGHILYGGWRNLEFNRHFLLGRLGLIWLVAGVHAIELAWGRLDPLPAIICLGIIGAMAFLHVSIVMRLHHLRRTEGMQRARDL